MSESEGISAVAAKEETEEKAILILQDKTRTAVVICDVCGYANPEHTSICKMCSNYLKEME